MSTVFIRRRIRGNSNKNIQLQGQEFICGPRQVRELELCGHLPRALALGPVGRIRRFAVSPLAKVTNGKKEVHRGRGGTMIYHTLLVDSPSDPFSPREIFADTDAGLVMILRDIAVDVCQGMRM